MPARSVALAAIAWIAVTTSGTAQSRESWAELMIVGRIEELSISPTHAIWLTTAMGTTYHADSAFGSWSYGPLQPSDSSKLLQATIERISFFNPDTAIATGYIGQEIKNQYFRTLDGGVTWDTLSLPSDLWVYDAQVSPQGHAWLVGSNGSFLRSEDFGATWSAPVNPFPDKARTQTVHMATATTGFVGGWGNQLSRTRDGGRTWWSIHTPLDQEAYDSTSRWAADDRIQKVRAFDRWIMVRQGGRTFVTPRDPITWRSMDPELMDFEVDPTGNRLVGVTRDRQVVAFDGNLDVETVADRPLPTPPVHIVIRDDVLYALDGLAVLHRVAGGQIRSGHPLTNEHEIRSVGRARVSASGFWGTSQTGVYWSDSIGGAWRRVGSVGIPIRGFESIDDTSIVIWDGHGTNLVFERDGSSRAATGLDGDVVDVVRVGGTLFAYGGKQYQTQERIEVARTYFAGQFAGSQPNGFVARSDDNGRTWRQIHEWDNEGVAALGVGPDHTLFLISYLGSVRTLHLLNGEYVWTDLIVAGPATHDSVPYHEEPYALYTTNARDFVITGWTHYLGRRAYESRDGGRSWHEASFARFPYSRIQWVDDRAFAISDDGVVEITSDQDSMIFRKPGGDTSVISDLSLTPQGRLLIQIVDADWASYFTLPTVTWHVVAIPGRRP